MQVIGYGGRGDQNSKEGLPISIRIAIRHGETWCLLGWTLPEILCCRSRSEYRSPPLIPVLFKILYFIFYSRNPLCTFHHWFYVIARLRLVCRKVQRQDVIPTVHHHSHIACHFLFLRCQQNHLHTSRARVLLSSEHIHPSFATVSQSV